MNRKLLCAGAALAVAWITVQPFPDLGAADALDLASGRAASTYFPFGSCAAVCLYLMASTDTRALKLLANPAYICLAVWVGLSIVTSQDVATSLKRAAICALQGRAGSPQQTDNSQPCSSHADCTPFLVAGFTSGPLYQRSPQPPLGRAFVHAHPKIPQALV